MKKLIYPFLLILLICGTNCKVTKYTPSDYPNGVLSFGTGGGFSGVVTEYSLLENGQFFKMSSHKEEHEEGNDVNMNLVLQIFHNYHFLGVGKMEFQHPGNLYHFITYKEGDHEHQIVWGDPAYPIPASINTYYNNLSKLITDCGFRPEPKEEDR